MNELSYMSNAEHSVPDYVALIPAAGIGSRMQATIPKQYLTINSKTILEWSIEAMLLHPLIKRVVVALHPDDQWFAKLAIAQHPQLSAVIGGAERAESVLAGLQACEQHEWVLVHDAARPCIRQTDITHLIDVSQHCACGAILAARVVDTIKRGKQSISATVDRSDLWRAYTPQLFPVARLRDNLKAALDAGHVVTDEASAMEWAKAPVVLVEGASDNIKITQPADLALAEWFLNQQGRCAPINETFE